MPATYPVFHRRGAMIVLNPHPELLFEPLPSHGLHLFLPWPRPGDKGRTVIRRYRMASQEVHWRVTDDGVLMLNVSAHPRPLELRLVDRRGEVRVTLDAPQGRE